MGFWSDVWNAAAAAAAAAREAAKKLEEEIKKKAAEALAKAQEAARKAAELAKQKAAEALAKAQEAARKAAELAKQKAAEALAKAKAAEEAARKAAENKKAAEEAARKAAEEKKKKEAEKAVDVSKKGWWKSTNNVIVTAGDSIFKLITGRSPTNDDRKIVMQKADWILPINVLTKIIYGVSIYEGEKPELLAKDYLDLALVLIPLPADKLLGIGGKIGEKEAAKVVEAAGKVASEASVKYLEENLLSGAGKVGTLLKAGPESMLARAVANPGALADELLSLSEKELEKLFEGLGKTSVGKTAISKIISLMEKSALEKSLEKKGLAAIAAKLKKNTILWGLAGILGIMGSAYGISFGTEWFAKEGLWELYSIPLSDKMRNYKYKPTPELKKLIEDDIKKLEEVVPKAQGLIKSVSWMWPFTMSAWNSYADSIAYELEGYKKELALTVLPGEMKVPEKVYTRVLDIIDGDTIDVAIQSKNLATNETFNLPEMQTTAHARIRMVGINSPEKSPKGEIICSDVEIYKVEGKWADEARSNLMPLNDKYVTLSVDPAHVTDGHGRILALVEKDGRNINLEQVKKGLACGYYFEPNKYVDENVYRKATLDAQKAGIGMWKGIEEVTKEEDKLKIIFNSVPEKAKLYIDGTYTHHLTPSDEKELADVIDLLKPGKHLILMEKAGMKATKEIEIKKGDNGTIHLVLEREPTETEIKPGVVEVEEEIKEITPTIISKLEELGPVKPEEILEEYTEGQEWALKEYFNIIKEEALSPKDMSEDEFEVMSLSYNLYTDEQKIVLDMLMRDLWPLIKGKEKLSRDEFQALLTKYKITL